MTRLEDPTHFLDLAFGYYMTGRFAALNQLDIAPNLMHHGVELLIKFTLLKDVSQEQQSTATELLAKKYGHRLNALWSRYKQYVAPADMSRFDLAIAELHKWEDVRYGGFPRADASIAKSVGLVRVPVSSSKTREVRAFGLHEIDDLFTAMLTASKINPSAIGSWYERTALPEWYARENQHVTPDLFGRARLAVGPLRPELAAPLGVRPSSQLSPCAGGCLGWRLSEGVAVLSCCTSKP